MVLNGKYKTTKLLGRAYDKTLWDLVWNKEFLGLTSKAQSIEGKIDILKSSVLQKTVRRMKRQATDKEELFANHIPDEGLTSRKWKEFSKPNSERNIQLEHKQKIRRNISSKKLYRRKKHMERSSTSLATREIQIKTTMRYHYTHIRMTDTKKWHQILVRTWRN